MYSSAKVTQNSQKTPVSQPHPPTTSETGWLGLSCILTQILPRNLVSHRNGSGVVADAAMVLEAKLAGKYWARAQYGLGISPGAIALKCPSKTAISHWLSF
ncbi:MAG: hypothetical protein KFF72_05385 [Arthrospira sp. SH-MAG29]|nr:hypothetical protein [Arthrospira sp. SH-MAG29]MBS0015786.1 hypothetical protein [Arthrospira sp. SH-MAG29]